jgi:hypothetical protein
MARKANKDTFVFEHVGVIEGDDTVVRRKVFAGDELLPQWEAENDSDVDEAEGQPNMQFGLGAAPHAYKSQLDESGAVKDEHKPEGQRRGRGRKSEQHETTKPADKPESQS